MDDQRERVVGCVLGLALGDALGAPFEFRMRQEIPDPLPAFERGWSGLPPGTWTDDTAMARNLWRSLAERRSSDPDDVLRRHLEWLATDPPDVGNLTRRVLSGIRDGVSDAAERYVSERGPEISAGNGSVMYCAPLGAFRAAHPELLLDGGTGALRDHALGPALPNGLPGRDARRRRARPGRAASEGGRGSDGGGARPGRR